MPLDSQAKPLPGNSAMLVNDTPDNICMAMGLGGFANDASMAHADRAIRILLLPAFGPEICLTYIEKDGACELHAAVPIRNIWQQVWPTPHRTPCRRARVIVDTDTMDAIHEQMEKAERHPGNGSVVISDGMQTYGVIRSLGTELLRIESAGRCNEEVDKAMACALLDAWTRIDHPEILDAIRSAGRYLDIVMPVRDMPLRTIGRFAVLGSDEEADLLWKAMHQDWRW